MAQSRPYYADQSLSAAHYDLITAADARLAGDVEIYAGLIPPDGAVLELGAGTGRVTAALAERGFKVLGVDIAPAMLRQAETRRAGLAPDVAARLAFQRGDMTALDLKRSFDAVICPYFTLAHVPAGTAWRNTFAIAARHLTPGGLAVFHLPLAEIMRAPGPARPDLPVMDQPLADGGRLQLHVRRRTFNDKVGRMDQVIEYVERDAKGAVRRVSPERQTYYVADPVPAAAQAGLTLDRPPIPHGGVGEFWVFTRV
jgi:SAM-dependent methyltransferase